MVGLKAAMKADWKAVSTAAGKAEKMAEWWDLLRVGLKVGRLVEMMVELTADL